MLRTVIFNQQLTSGIVRELAFKSENVHFVRATTSAGGVASGGHPQRKHNVYRYIVSGRLRFEYSIIAFVGTGHLVVDVKGPEVEE